MDYSIEKITTTADCDVLLQMANAEKDTLSYKHTGETRQIASIANGTVSVETELEAVNAEITTLEAVIPTLAPGSNIRNTMEDKLVRANFRKHVLQQRSARYSVLALLQQQFDVNCVEKLQAEAETYIAALNQRKEEIG